MDRVACGISLVPVHGPLVGDHHDKITKQALHEQHLRNESTNNINGLAEELGVVVDHADSERHVDHSKDDRHLHLVRVGEKQVVFSSVPRIVNAKRIGVSIGLSNNQVSSHVIFRESEYPSSLEEWQDSRENIVVHHSSEDRKGSHKKDNIATSIDHTKHLAKEMKKIEVICKWEVIRFFPIRFFQMGQNLA